MSNNFNKTDPALKDLLNISTKDVMLSLNCHAIGTIQAFYPEDQTADVLINYTQQFYVRQSDGTYALQQKNYPALVSCPCVMLTGGSAFISMPISAGDTCLVLFNDRDFSDWWGTGNTSAVPPTAQLHALGDAIALVGIRSKINAIPSYDQTRARLQNGDTYVGVSGSKVTIQNASQNLYSVLNSLIIALQTFATSAKASSTDPTLVAAATALEVAIKTATNLSTELGEILE